MLQGEDFLKRVNNLFPDLISDDNLLNAILKVNATHRWTSRHQPNKTVQWVESDVPARVHELRTIIINGFTPAPCRKSRRWDKSSCKWRDICEPQLWPDQYVHHALVQILEPVMMRGMDPFCCGSIRGRGIHYGLKAIKKWMRDDLRGTKYCLELDIRHFYDSIQPSTVVDCFRDLVKDYRMIDLIERITKNGVQIGLYTSQWFANTLLQPLDHQIREGEYHVAHYLRYMDNFTIFSSNKRTLKKLFVEIRKYLDSIGLEIKGNWQIFCTADRMPCALGYRYGHGYTLLRKRNLMRLKRQLRRYYGKVRKHERVSLSMASGLLSRFAQLHHCNHTQIYNLIYEPKTQRDLKSVVRNSMKYSYSF